MADGYGLIPAILRNYRKGEGDNFDQNRQNLRFRAEPGPYIYRDWDIFDVGSARVYDLAGVRDI